MPKKERDIQPRIIKRVEERLPGCIIFKGDTRFRQGTPDLIILHKDKWAMLEVKKSSSASRQPNQEYYISKLNEMSYAAFIHPGNEEEVLNDLQRSLES